MSSASAMAADYAPITIKEAFTLPSIGINPQFINSMHVTMESDKYICVQETAPRNSVVIIDMSMPNQPVRRFITADSVLMNPKSGFIVLKVQLPGTTQDHLQIFHIEVKAKMKSHSMPEQIVFWKWVTPKMLGLVTQTSVYHWPIAGDLEPVKMFERTSNLASNQIINYRCDPAEKWLVLIGIAPGSPERPQLVKGNMQLFSVDQQLSQALEAHAVSFATFKFPGNENPSTLICVTSKTTNAGQVTSKLHVIELDAQPGKPTFTKVQADLLFPPDFADDFPVAMQISRKYGLIYVITKLGLLFVYDLETATAVYQNQISPDPIFLTSEASSVGGFYAVNRRGQVLLATVNEARIVPFVSSQLNNLELAVNLAKRGNLPGDENLFVQRFQELFSQAKYEEAVEFVAESPQGILRTPDTLAKFQSVPVQTGQTPPLELYFWILLDRGKLNAFETLEMSRLVVNKKKMLHNKKDLLENWLAEDKLECSEELGDLVKTMDNDLAQKIYIKARATPKVVAAFAERQEFDKILIYSKQEKEERLDGDANEDERRAKSKSIIEPNGSILSGKVPQKNEQSIQGSNASLYSVKILMEKLALEKAERYSFDELATFTSKFHNIIGSGAFGIVYKGQISDGTEVAVKVLKRLHDIHHSFLTEIKTMGKTNHQNLIKLIGFCLEESMLALVYEYMENGSLDKILYKKPLTLEWDKLYAIAVELANALVYLHGDCGDQIQIIHHDIKASNVLLDSNHLPKLSDFGLANLKDLETTHLTLTKCRGTPGYAAPEIWTPFSQITSKCDVYSFGMILFEILGKGKNNRTDIWFPRHVWNKFNSGTLDDLITECGISENDRKKATILSLVALWCSQHTPEARPPMSMVATVLKDEIRVKTPPNPFLLSDSSHPMQPA